MNALIGAVPATMPDITTVLLALVVIFVGAKLFGEIAERLHQPAVLGELVAGVVLGGSVLGLVPANDPTLHLLAEIGVIILLFEIGLETDLATLLRVGPASSAVAVVGVAVPFVLGVVGARMLGVPMMPAIVCGAALTATSVGITARVLADLGRLHDKEGQIILGAAVIDDVIGLVILAVVGELVAGRSISALGIARTTVLAFGFLAVAILVGRRVVPPMLRLVARFGNEEILAPLALALAFLLAVAAEQSGSARIVGAFAAGLAIAPAPDAAAVRRGTVGLARFFVPIFFVMIGAAVDVRALAGGEALRVGAMLVLVGALGKFVAGWAPFWIQARRSVIGVGMIPRGEVGLIFAQMGLTAGVLAPPTFGAIMLMVMATTLLAPPLLRYVLARGRPVAPSEALSGLAEVTTEA